MIGVKERVFLDARKIWVLLEGHRLLTTRLREYDETCIKGEWPKNGMLIYIPLWRTCHKRSSLHGCWRSLDPDRKLYSPFPLPASPLGLSSPDSFCIARPWRGQVWLQYFQKIGLSFFFNCLTVDGSIPQSIVFHEELAVAGDSKRGSETLYGLRTRYAT